MKSGAYIFSHFYELEQLFLFSFYTGQESCQINNSVASNEFLTLSAVFIVGKPVLLSLVTLSLLSYLLHPVIATLFSSGP
jgi:hypothetical protein